MNSKVGGGKKLWKIQSLLAGIEGKYLNNDNHFDQKLDNFEYFSGHLNQPYSSVFHLREEVMSIKRKLCGVLEMIKSSGRK